MNLQCSAMSNKKLNIVGITTCVGYSPLLSLMLEENVKILKHIYVVTKCDDHDTIKTCKKYNNVTILIHDFNIM